MATTVTSAIGWQQRWPGPRATPTSVDRYCTPFTLPSDGVLSLGDTLITLTTNVVFQPQCTGVSASELSSVADNIQPFYASVIPQVYVVAAATVIAWILVIMLIITPRTNLGMVLSPAVGRGHGIIAGASGGSTNLSGVGSRPWLQKVAALTVAVALTIATADTFSVARDQYDVGVMDADTLRNEVLQSLEILITRVISDVFVWLAQVQTLIRLFPRHKEKVLIKWIGFGLIVLDTIFSCLKSFIPSESSAMKPRNFQDAISALSYLFELALGLLYAAWVIYYALIKRRYAFYRPKMRSICVIALLSLISILTPVVFFVTDVSNPDVAGWGDYFRWVGAAAASVVVWEWVERIEALERDEKKDGILGREIFDGDEMLDLTPSQEMVWRPSGRNRYRGTSSSGDGSGIDEKKTAAGPGRLTQRFRHKQQQLIQHFPLGRAHSATTRSTPEPGQSLNGQINGQGNGRVAFGNLPKPSGGSHDVLGGLTPPPAVASPINRAETSSAGSTVYVVRYDAVADLPQPPARPQVDINGNGAKTRAKIAAQHANGGANEAQHEGDDDDEQMQRNRARARWQSVANPFKRKRASPPAEVQQAREAAAAAAGRSLTPAHRSMRWGFRHRGAAAGNNASHAHSTATSSGREAPLIVIPAQRRGGDSHVVSVDSSTMQRSSAHRKTTTTEAIDLSNASASTTLTANSHQDFSAADRSNSSGPERQARRGGQGRSTPNVMQPNAPASTASAPSAPSLMRTVSAPPRADDISPTAGGTAIIPAPRRSPLWRQDTSTGGTPSVGASDHRHSPRHGT